MAKAAANPAMVTRIRDVPRACLEPTATRGGTQGRARWRRARQQRCPNQVVSLILMLRRKKVSDNGREATDEHPADCSRLKGERSFEPKHPVDGNHRAENRCATYAN